MRTVRFRLLFFLGLLLAVIVLGTFSFMLVENLSFPDAFYFSVVTIATVGYGDIHPSTTEGKMMAVVMIVMGAGAFVEVLASAAEMMLNRRERQARLARLNIAIGVFFSEVGTQLLSLLSKCDCHMEVMRRDLIIANDWSDQRFSEVRQHLGRYTYNINIHNINLEDVRSFMLQKRDIMLRLLENPNLHEHESFTDLLQAVFHLAEELTFRDQITDLPKKDYEHLAGDMQRVYAALVLEWLNYMKHLKESYPYLFSLAVRTNPFDNSASPIVH